MRFAFSSIYRLKLLHILALLLLTGPVHAASPPQPLTEWAYRYNDTYMTLNGVTGSLGEDSSAWQLADSPSNPPVHKASG